MKKETAFGRGGENPSKPLSALRLLRWIICAGIPVFALLAAGCAGTTYEEPKEVKVEPPKVSYNYSSDEDLIAANSKARAFCSQYASTPSMKGAVTEKSDGTKTVTFVCIKTAETPPPAASPLSMSYSYTTDAELQRAIQLSEAYCARTGQIPSSSIVASPGGTKTLTFQCVSP